MHEVFLQRSAGFLFCAIRFLIHAVVHQSDSFTYDLIPTPKGEYTHNDHRAVFVSTFHLPNQGRTTPYYHMSYKTILLDYPLV